jgi:hypothetical protein
MQEASVVDPSLKDLFMDHPGEPLPAIIADYYRMLENLRRDVSDDLRQTHPYNNSRYFVAVLEDDFKREEHPVKAAGWDVAEYSLINSIVVQKKSIFPLVGPSIAQGIVVVRNHLFDDYLDIVYPSVDEKRQMTDADFEGHERSLEIAVLDTRFAKHIETRIQQYARAHNFHPVTYSVE